MIRRGLAAISEGKICRFSARPGPLPTWNRITYGITYWITITYGRMAFYGFLSSHNFGRKLTGFKNDHLGTWFEIFPNFGFFIRMLTSALIRLGIFHHPTGRWNRALPGHWLRSQPNAIDQGTFPPPPRLSRKLGVAARRARELSIALVEMHIIHA